MEKTKNLIKFYELVNYAKELKYSHNNACDILDNIWQSVICASLTIKTKDFSKDGWLGKNNSDLRKIMSGYYKKNDIDEAVVVR